MKKIYKIVTILLVGVFTQTSFSQCTNTSSWGGATAPTGGATNNMSTCNYASEYATVTGVAAATSYRITSSVATDFITVHQGTFNGPVIAFGVQPLNWTSTVGGNYYIHINTDAACGTQSTCRSTDITHVPAPNDTPCSAWTITVGCGGSKLIGNNTGMTNSSIANPSCGSYTGGDVWFSLIVPASGKVKVETYARTLTDMAMAIYSVSGGCNSTFTQLSCDDNSGFGNMPKSTLTGLTPGNKLYVRVWDKNNDQTGDFEIDASDLFTNYCVTGNSVDQGAGCAQLTSATNNQLGSIWDADNKFDFTSDWSYDFTVNLGNSDAGADGICFVIQNDPAGLSAFGTSGGAMGSGGITNSLIVEIDTYLNTEDRNDGLTSVTCGSGTPDPDHLDIWLNGVVNPGDCSSGARVVPNAVELKNGAALYNIENGLNHTFRVSYVAATQTFTAKVLNAAKTVTYGTISYSPLNPLTLFGSNAPYFGFTGSTGGLNNQQSACLAPSLVLPITLTNFDVNCNGSEKNISWATASEINNDYFTIERSSDAINFEEIGRIDGAGNSNINLNYSFTDVLSIPKIVYYRLKQTDFNGEFSYSEIKSASCIREGDFSVYPNPFEDKLFIQLSEGFKFPINIEITDFLGRTVYSKIIEDEAKSLDLDLKGENFVGACFIQIYNETQRKTQKIIKQK